VTGVLGSDNMSDRLQGFGNSSAYEVAVSNAKGSQNIEVLISRFFGGVIVSSFEWRIPESLQLRFRVRIICSKWELRTTYRRNCYIVSHSRSGPRYMYQDRWNEDLAST
jgi:hypothetical protein